MGILKKQNLGLGVELGEASGKAVLLEQNGHRLRVTHALYLNRHSEGFLDEQEMRQAFSQWILENDIAQVPAAGNLSQHLTLEAVYDFPPDVRWGNLRKMVDFQTQSLCGITEEEFICGAQKLNAKKDGRNRILIAASRELVVDRCYEDFLEAGVNVRMMAENGQALTNAFLNLHPEAFQKDNLQMILNVDRNHTVLVLFKGGHLLYVTGLTTGGEGFVRCLKQLLKCDDYQAEKDMVTYEADWQNPASPFHHAMKNFINELNTVLLHWKMNGNARSATDSPLNQVWLTGASTIQIGFAEEMSRLLGCNVVRFGVPAKLLSKADISCPQDLDFNPCLTLAYGLALQALNKSVLTISLLPRNLQRRLRHISDFPYLCAGVACCLVVLVTLICAFTWQLNGHIKELEDRRDALEQCKKIIPEIEKSQQELKLRYRRMLPLLEYGRRSHLFAQALINCQRVLQEPAQGKLAARAIYLADEFSFTKEYGTIPETQEQQDMTETRKKNFLTAVADKRLAPKDKGPFVDRMPPPQNVCQVDTMPRVTKMYLGGLTEQNEARFETLKKIQENFTLEQLFANVDDYTDSYQDNAQADSPTSWRKFLQDNQARLNNRITMFLLQLPFQEEVPE